MRSFDKLTDLQALVGQDIGSSDWIVVDQNRINLFADATGDHQWIHIDPLRAAAGLTNSASGRNVSRRSVARGISPGWM